MGRSTDGHEPDRRRSRVAKGLVLLAATALIALATGMASAQQLPEPLPEPPSIEGCAADPASCLPDPEEVDPCLEDPRSCLPGPPPVDECTQDPSGCLPEPPPVDECLQHPESCVPQGQDVDRCVENPRGCLPEAVGGGENPSKEEHGEGDDHESAAPGPDRDRSRPRRPGPSSDEGNAAFADRRAPPAATDLRERPASSVAVPPAGGLLDRIGRGLTDAAQRFAFPLAVAGLAAAFVLVQGRIDRRDPKLAVAPIHSRHDVVEFR